MSLQIRDLGGYYPLQAEGTIDGVEFYFRAIGRPKKWWFAVGQDPVGILMGVVEGYKVEGEYEHDPPMLEKEARELIRICAEAYQAHQRERHD